MDLWKYRRQGKREGAWAPGPWSFHIHLLILEPLWEREKKDLFFRLLLFGVSDHQWGMYPK